MKRKTHIETETEGIDLYFEENEDDYSPVDIDIAKAAEVLGCSPKLLDTLLRFKEDITESVSTDLKQMYEDVEKIKGALQESGLLE